MHLVLPQVEPIDTYVNGRRIEPTEPGGRIREDEDTDGLGGIQQRESAIYRLASKISAQSSAQSPFQATPGGPCDPNGPNFNSKTWISTFYSLHLDEQTHSVGTGVSRFEIFRYMGLGAPQNSKRQLVTSTSMLYR